jgi:hypothetical protein
MSRKILAALSLTLALCAGGCASAPQLSNSQIADACDMLTDNRGWYDAMRKTAREWGAPMGLQLAIIKQESTFESRARPERGPNQWIFFPGRRPSSAYGYAQALDSTWENYKTDTGHRGADRHNFSDSVDFIGWYVNQSAKRANIGQFDYRAHYLAYHEGAGGYVRGTWRNNRTLIASANRVAADAARYEAQIRDCRGLRQRFLGIF